MPAISSTNPRSCLRGKGLHHRADVFRRITASVLIGQIKKTILHAQALFLPEGVGSNRQHCVSSRCPKIRSWTLRSINTTKLALIQHTIFEVGSFGPIQAKAWWSQTGSNRRHPACKAGALPAELRPLITFVSKGSGGPGRT